MMTREIPLTRGYVALVDDADYEWLSQWKWLFDGRYAIRFDGDRTILMHRLINETPEGRETDHIDRNHLNNCRNNLRTATRANNMCNRSGWGSTSQYKGVCWSKRSGKWHAYITFNKNHKHLGYFQSELDAARAYNRAALRYHGEFARLNDIPE